MAYEIRTSDGALVTIQDGSANSNPQYTIDLVGRNTFNYGFYIAETQLHLLENFASTNKKPNFPTPGQLWYNKADKSLYVNTGDNIHNHEAWSKLFIGDAFGTPDEPVDGIFVDEITGGLFNGGDFVGDDFTGNAFHGGTFSGSTFTGTNFNGGTFTGSFVGNLQGNAATASKWATARTITLTGDVTGSVSIDGSANVSLAAVVVDDLHNHVIANVDGLQTALDGKSASNHTHPGVIISAIALTATDHLDNFKTPGFYFQSANANASTSRGYPEASAGSLMVSQAAGPVQQYHVYNSSRIYYRGQTGAGAWTAWAEQYNTLNKPTVGDVGAQPLDATLSALAALTTSADRVPYFTGSDAASLATFTAFARTLLDDNDAASMRTTIGAQPLDATLTALSGLSTSADRLPYFTGPDTANVTVLTSFARTLLDDGDAGAVRSTIGAAPTAHGHAISDVSGLQGALDGKSPTSHTHTPASIGAAAVNHTHSSSSSNSDLISGGYGQIGTYMLAQAINVNALYTGDLIAGSNLKPVAMDVGNWDIGPTGLFSGTWKLLGYNNTGRDMMSLYFRVA